MKKVKQRALLLMAVPIKDIPRLTTKTMECTRKNCKEIAPAAPPKKNHSGDFTTFARDFAVLVQGDHIGRT